MDAWFFRRSGDRHPVYLVCALLFVGIGASGAEYGALPLYLVPAVICAVQFGYPTALGWTLVFMPVALLTALWAFVLARDLMRLVLGHLPSVLRDFDDSVVFVLLLAFSIGATAWLYRLRPRRLAD